VNFARRLLWPADPGAFRLWLALVVVVHHVTRIEVGKAPVLVFFALSGFWVHRVWWAQYCVTERPWLTFVVSRWWRIAPLMMLAGLTSAGAMLAVHHHEWPLVAGTATKQMLSGVFVLGYAQLPTRPLGPGWSLDIEMQFYMLAPLLLLLVRRARALLAMLLAVLVAEFGLLAGLGVLLPPFLPWFTVGMLASEHGWQVGKGAARASFIGTVALFAFALTSPWRSALLDEFGSDYAWFNMLLALGVLPFALYGVGRTSDARDGVLADYSYLVYLTHWPAIVLWRGIDWGGGGQRWLALGLLGMAVSWACRAARLWLDRPMHRLRKVWVSRQAAAYGKKDDSAALLA
jgi:peptidoglycan/LPS O-acetylase OafA/YrhL